MRHAHASTPGNDEVGSTKGSIDLRTESVDMTQKLTQTSGRVEASPEAAYSEHQEAFSETWSISVNDLSSVTY